MVVLLAVPALTAVVVIACAFRSDRRGLLWFGLALAVINLALAPVTSGEWFYQRAEAPAFEQAVVSADFSAFDDMTSRHDPYRLHKMISVAVALLGAVVMLWVAQLRTGRELTPRRAPAAVAIAAGAVGLGSLAALTALGSGG